VRKKTHFKNERHVESAHRISCYLPLMSGASSKRRLLYVLLAALVLDAIVAKTMSQTMDEADHLNYGAKILHGQPDRDSLYFDSKTPLTALNALPRVIAEHIHSFPRIRRLLWSMVRFSSILFALIVIVLIYTFANEWYGPEAALFGAILAALSPNLIAHGTLATNDGYFAAGVLSSLYFLRRYLLQPTTSNAVISGSVVALAQLTKPLAIYLFPVTGAFLILAMFRPDANRMRAGKLAAYLAITAGATILVFNVAYSFDRTFTHAGSYQFESPSWNEIRQSPWIENIPVPLPYPVLQGFDKMVQTNATDPRWGKVYLLGNLRRIADPDFHGFKSYTIVAWFFKEPIPLQILFVWGLIFVANRRRKDFLFNEGMLLAAAGVLVAWTSLSSKAQVGIRHTLPALAIEVVIASAPFSNFSEVSRRKKTALSALLVWLCLSTLSYYPNMIPYMNEWLFDRRLSYRILADSNLDWGQDMGTVRTFLKANPDVVLDPDLPVSRRVLVSADRLVGIIPRDKGPLSWALRLKPVAQVGYAHFLFEIPPAEVVNPSSN
jgi:hypothetical protein